MSNPNWFKDLFIDEAKPALHGSNAGSGGNTGGSADWNQNDSAKPGYIKNRPFFTKGTERTIIFPETTVDMSQEDSGLVFGEIGGGWIYLEAGKTYTVMLNGTSYESVARAIPPEIGMSGFILGNGPLASADNEHNNEPFFIIIFDEMRLQEIYAPIYLKGTNTLSIEYIQEEIQHIDPKYIKDMYSDNRTYRVIEGTVTGEVNSYHQVKLIDNIEFDFNKVETVSLSTSAGTYIKDVPITSDDGKWFYVGSNDVYIPLFLVEDGILYTLVGDVCEPGTSVEVTYSFSVVDGKLNKLKSEYSPIVETKINQIFYADILDTDRFEGSYQVITGEALVITDDCIETVQFIDDGGYSYADLNHCSWVSSIEISANRVRLNTSLDGQTEHYIQILSISETIKDQYLPGELAKKQDIENIIEQHMGPVDQQVRVQTIEHVINGVNNYGWCSACYGDGKFVVAGTTAAARAYSEDGIHWSEVTDYSFQSYNSPSICYGDGKFVIVAYNNQTSMYSEDGKTWSYHMLPLSTSWSSICYGDGKFVTITGGASERNNIGAYSIDGKTWVQTELPAKSYWREVCYGNGQFVAVGNGHIAVSVDGISWTDSEIDAELEQVCYGDGKFIATNTYSTNVYVSSDGLVWKKIDFNKNQLDLSGGLHYILYDGEKFCGVSRNQLPSERYFVTAYSYNGIDWVVKQMPERWTQSTTSQSFIAYGNNIYIAMHRSAFGGNFYIRSTDGINWYSYCKQLIDSDGNDITKDIARALLG